MDEDNIRRLGRAGKRLKRFDAGGHGVLPRGAARNDGLHERNTILVRKLAHATDVLDAGDDHDVKRKIQALPEILESKERARQNGDAADLEKLLAVRHMHAAADAGGRDDHIQVTRFRPRGMNLLCQHIS